MRQKEIENCTNCDKNDTTYDTNCDKISRFPKQKKKILVVKKQKTYEEDILNRLVLYSRFSRYFKIVIIIKIFLS